MQQRFQGGGVFRRVPALERRGRGTAEAGIFRGHGEFPNGAIFQRHHLAFAGKRQFIQPLPMH